MKSIPLKIAQVCTFIVLLILSIVWFFNSIGLVFTIFSPNATLSQKVMWKVPVRVESKDLTNQVTYRSDSFEATKIEYKQVWLEVTATQHKAFFQTMVYLAFLGLCVIAFPFYYFLFHVLASIETTPFSSENLSRIRNMGLLVIVGELYRFFLFVYLSVSFVDIVDIQTIDIAPIGWTNLNFQILFLGIIILIIGEVFKRGFILQENENLTV